MLALVKITTYSDACLSMMHMLLCMYLVALCRGLLCYGLHEFLHREDDK